MKKFLVLILIGFQFLSNAQKLSESSTISLLTCAPGEEIYSVYGHNAIRIKDPILKIDKVYNYGTFDFNEPGFMMKFLRGKLRYRLAAGDFRQFVASYNYEERGIVESVLNLDSKQKQAFFDALETNLKPENRWYMYDFFYDNCATRIRDIVEEVYGEQLNYPEKTEKLTLRNMLDKYTHLQQWLTFGQSLIVGANSDKEADLRQQMFIPDYLNDHLKNSTLKTANGKVPVIISEKKIIHFNKKHDETIITPIMIFIIFLLWELFLFIKKKKGKWIKFYDKTIYSILAISSIVVLVMWFLTDHGATKTNWNILWLNPLFILLVFTSKSSQYFRPISNGIIGFLILALLYKILPQDYYPGVFILIVSILLNLLRNRFQLTNKNQ